MFVSQLIFLEHALMSRRVWTVTNIIVIKLCACIPVTSSGVHGPASSREVWAAIPSASQGRRYLLQCQKCSSEVPCRIRKARRWPVKSVSITDLSLYASLYPMN